MQVRTFCRGNNLKDCIFSFPQSRGHLFFQLSVTNFSNVRLPGFAKSSHYLAFMIRVNITTLLKNSQQ